MVEFSWKEVGAHIEVIAPLRHSLVTRADEILEEVGALDLLLALYVPLGARAARHSRVG